MQFLLALLLTSSVWAAPTYLITSQHPHDLEVILPHVTTVKQEGRMWLVELKPGAPKKIMAYLREVDPSVKMPFIYAPRTKMKADTDIKEVLQEVSIPKIKAAVETLANYPTRRVGTDGNRQAVTWLSGELRTLGMVPQEICYREGACSIVAEKKGTEDGVILVEAHMDSVGANMAGADDNASGTSALLEIARLLKDRTNKYSWRFFITNGEESGLLGAEHYAKLLSDSGEIRKLKLVINMDMVGYNANGIVELETNPEYEDLAKWFASLAQTYTVLTTKITLNAWGSDHVPFLDRDVSTLLTIEDWSTKTPCYHTACDKPDTINYNYMAEIVKLNTAAVLTKDAQ